MEVVASVRKSPFTPSRIALFTALLVFLTLYASLGSFERFLHVGNLRFRLR